MRTIVRKINIKSDGKDWWIHSKDIELYCRSIEEINSHPHKSVLKSKIGFSFDERIIETGHSKGTYSFNRKKTSIIELHILPDDDNEFCYVSINFHIDTKNIDILKDIMHFINSSLNSNIHYSICPSCGGIMSYTKISGAHCYECDHEINSISVAEKPMSEGLVYFVQGGPFVKIGHVKKNDKKLVDSRIRTLQTSCPYKLKLLLIEFGGYNREQQLHVQFEKHHAHNEWFHLSDVIEKYLRENEQEQYGVLEKLAI